MCLILGPPLQVCVATLMAQVGAWLPAESVVLSPADAIFVRMGAKDHILMGQSTFFVELSETASMLSRVTQCAPTSLMPAACLMAAHTRSAVFVVAVVAIRAGGRSMYTLQCTD